MFMRSGRRVVDFCCFQAMTVPNCTSDCTISELFTLLSKPEVVLVARWRCCSIVMSPIDSPMGGLKLQDRKLVDKPKCGGGN